MAKVHVDTPDSRTTPQGVNLRLVKSGEAIEVARFAAFINGNGMKPGGEMLLHLGVPFDQVMNAMPVMQYIGGVTFEITVRRVPIDQLPEPGW